MSIDVKVLELFGCLVTDTPNVIQLRPGDGVVVDFTPTPKQWDVITQHYKQLFTNTLFTVSERQSSDFMELVHKQLQHYSGVYGCFDLPGAFDLPLEGDRILTLTYVKGISVEELCTKILGILYANAPIKDVNALAAIIRHYEVDFDLNSVKNNEARIALYGGDKEFDNGDDAVRWLCYNATESALLIKSKAVINQIKTSLVPVDFFQKHRIVLAEVFNRHKPLILAAKNSATKSVINEISRLSKRHHCPIKLPASKTIVADFLAGRMQPIALVHLSLRDKFNILNLVRYKASSTSGSDAYNIRNGKVWIKTRTDSTPNIRLGNLYLLLLNAIEHDLSHLKGKRVRCDVDIDYGLPISRKQTLGNLPFGTKITVDGEISSGVYWENAGGATDLDLSTIDLEGGRVGWGCARGYNDPNITFSGDVTNAPKGAMEFMTSSTDTYGLFVNIFSGDEKNSKMELVVGSRDPSNKKWIDKCVIREKHTLQSRGNMLGFVHQSTFTVQAGRLNSNRVSSDREKAIVERMCAPKCTVREILEVVGATIVTDNSVACDYDLSYNQFSYDKLEELFELN